MGRQLPTRFDTTMVAKARASQPRIPPISIGSVPSSTVGARVWTAPARAAPRSLAWRGDQPAARHGPDHGVGAVGPLVGPEPGDPGVRRWFGRLRHGLRVRRSVGRPAARRGRGARSARPSGGRREAIARGDARHPGRSGSSRPDSTSSPRPRIGTAIPPFRATWRSDIHLVEEGAKKTGITPVIIYKPVRCIGR